jgi:SAM-dependent methyltransferase
MHAEARDFTLFVKQLFPEFFNSINKVLDVGSGDINGNNRFLFNPRSEYHGNDVYAARNVTIVSKTKDLPFPDETFDVIVSTECFEHDPEYEQSFQKILKMLKPGGLFVFTCASTKRPEHGTRRTSRGDSYGTIAGIPDMQDYYKNLTIQDVETCIDLSVFKTKAAYYNMRACDLYFYGIKSDESRSLPAYITQHVIRTM